MIEAYRVFGVVLVVVMEMCYHSPGTEICYP